MANQNSTPTPIAEQAPKTLKITGELLAVSELDGQEITLLSIQDKDDEVHTVSTSTKYWKKVGRAYNPGAILQVQYEQRIAGKTTYKTEDGEVVLHKNSGNSVVGVTPYSAFAWKKEQSLRQRADDLQYLDSQEPEKALAVATYLNGTFGKW